MGRDFYLNFHCSITYLYKAASLVMIIALQEEILAVWAAPELFYIISS